MLTTFKYSQYIGPFIIACLVLVAGYFEPLASEWLAYDRYAIEGWETWRLFTGNLVHTNVNHLLLNLAGLILLSLLHYPHYRTLRFLKVFTWCAIATSLGIYFYSPSLIGYAGLSGALHGVFVWGACMDIRNKTPSGWLLLIGVIGKIIYEQNFGSSQEIADLINATVAIDAHLYGGIAGFILFLLMPGVGLFKRKKSGARQ